MQVCLSNQHKQAAVTSWPSGSSTVIGVNTAAATHRTCAASHAARPETCAGRLTLCPHTLHHTRVGASRRPHSSPRLQGTHTAVRLLRPCAATRTGPARSVAPPRLCRWHAPTPQRPHAPAAARAPATSLTLALYTMLKLGKIFLTGSTPP